MLDIKVLVPPSGEEGAWDGIVCAHIELCLMDRFEEAGIEVKISDDESSAVVFCSDISLLEEVWDLVEEELDEITRYMSKVIDCLETS